MKVLVTGGSGFIGSHIVEELLKNNHEVRIFDRKPPTNKDLDFFQGDLTNKEHLKEALKDIDAISHQAAAAGFHLSYADYVLANSVGTANIIDTIKENSLPIKKIIFASSSAIYGEGSYSCKEHGIQNIKTRPLTQLQNKQWEPLCPKCSSSLESKPTKESKKLQNTHIYAVTKASGEKMLSFACDELDIDFTAFRYSLVYGPREPNKIFSIFSRQILNDQPISLNEDGNQIREFLYVKDIAEANLFALQNKVNGIFNLGTSQPTTLKEFCQLLSEAYDKSLNLDLTGNFRAGDTRHLYTDNSKLTKQGFTPKTSLKQGIQNFLGWIEEQNQTPKDFFKL